MSRANYSDDLDPLDLGRWRGRVASAMRGKRGQAFLREMLAALDAMPEKRLVPHEFEADGEVCALGCVAKLRGIDLSKFDPDDSEVGDAIGDALGIAGPMAREIMFENDEFIVWDRDFGRRPDDPAKRWEHMRKWIADRIIEKSTG